MSDAETLIDVMDAYIKEHGLPVNLALSADSGFEVSIQRLAVHVGSRRQGYAGKVLAELVDQADTIGVDISLEAFPDEDDGAIGMEALGDFYRSHGFSGDLPEEGEPYWMSRSAKAPAPGMK